jgi:hypothetical protein
MPNTDNFHALKMEFIDCDVSHLLTPNQTLSTFVIAKRGTSIATKFNGTAPANPRTNHNPPYRPRWTCPRPCPLPQLLSPP